MFNDAAFWAIVAAVVFVLSPMARNLSLIVGGNKRIERKLDLIVNHLGIDSNQSIDGKLRELVKAGKKIEAIKVYREETGAGLKEAKDYVEGLS